MIGQWTIHHFHASLISRGCILGGQVVVIPETGFKYLWGITTCVPLATPFTSGITQVVSGTNGLTRRLGNVRRESPALRLAAAALSALTTSRANTSMVSPPPPPPLSEKWFSGTWKKWSVSSRPLTQGQGLTLVHSSAQPDPFSSLKP